VKREVTTMLARVHIRSEEEIAAMEAAERAQAEAQAQQMQFQHPNMAHYGEAEPALLAADPEDPMFANVGRNDPCPCGSGQKFKHCHGQLA